MTDLPTDDASRKLMLALADRCEKATREYDPDLCDAVHDILPWPKCIQPPNYNASIDAAISLVPEGWDWGAAGYAIDTETGSPYGWAWVGPDGEGPYTFAKSVALALCAAGLRARATML